VTNKRTNETAGPGDVLTIEPGDELQVDYTSGEGDLSCKEYRFRYSFSREVNSAGGDEIGLLTVPEDATTAGFIRMEGSNGSRHCFTNPVFLIQQ
jgi:hypothetical protein